MDSIELRRCDLLHTRPKAEQALCKVLDYIHIKYIIQQPIKTPRKLFYADIYIPALRLILECDGGYHTTQEQKRKDANRSAILRGMGLHVYRMPNKDCYQPKKVINKLRYFAKNQGITLTMAISQANL